MIALIFYINIYHKNASNQGPQKFNIYQEKSVIVKEALVNDNVDLQNMAKPNPKYLTLAHEISNDISAKYKNYNFQVYLITGSTKKITKSEYPAQQFIYIDTKDKLSKLLLNEEEYVDFVKFIRNKSLSLNPIVSQKDPQNSSDQIIVGNNLNRAETLPFPSDNDTDIYIEYGHNLDIQKYILNKV